MDTNILNELDTLVSVYDNLKAYNGNTQKPVGNIYHPGHSALDFKAVILHPPKSSKAQLIRNSYVDLIYET